MALVEVENVAVFVANIVNFATWKGITLSNLVAVGCDGIFAGHKLHLVVGLHKLIVPATSFSED